MKTGYLHKEIKQDLIDIRNGAMITPILTKLVKLVVCDKCYGKGYGTSLRFAGTRRASWQLSPVMLCDCPRGKQLKKHYNIKKIGKRNTTN